MLAQHRTAIPGPLLEVTHESEAEEAARYRPEIIKPAIPSQPEKAQIDIHDAEDLYREIRIENVVGDEKGEKAQLKPGAKVDVIIEADSSATTKKPDSP